MSVLDAAIITFSEEDKELLEEMEDSLLSLEETPDDIEVVNSVFRAMHTIKGSSGLFGFDAIVSFTHEAETILDQVRNNEREIDNKLISILLDCKDHTSSLLSYYLDNAGEELTDELVSTGNDLVTQLTGKDPSSEASTTEISPADDTLESMGNGSDLSDCWLISLKFQTDAFRMGVDPLSFLRYLKTLGDIKTVLLVTEDIPSNQTFDPESCYLHLKIALNSDADKQTIEDVFEFASDDCDINILPPNSKVDQYLSLLDELPEDHVSRLGGILIEVGVLTKNDIAKAVQKQTASDDENSNDSKPIGAILVEQQVVQPAVIDQALKKQKLVKQKVAVESSFIRVDSNKLGQLINLVGELVISGAAMNLMVERHGLTDVEEVATTMTTLVSGIRDTALELRMVPIGDTFSRFRRVVRDVSKELGKEIELAIAGGEAELDKTVVEKINDPLTHLIRNSLDHGIETPEQRKQAGKTEPACIQLNAYHQSGNIVIEIIDNGAGLDTEKILAKAIANEIIPEDHNLTQQEIFNLIFAAGLSTKAQASDLSGRGVGMDVVRRNIESLRGSVNIHSVAGQGTTITIRLPLTLAIIDGFMVECAKERYIIPLTMVEECVEMDSSDCDIDEVQNYINLRGQAMPYLRIGDYFNGSSKNKNNERESLVVVKFGQSRAGFVVDQLHGEHQTVIKPLGKVFETVEGLTGATVLGDGNVALILDVQGLITKATSTIN